MREIALAILAVGMAYIGYEFNSWLGHLLFGVFATWFALYLISG